MIAEYSRLGIDSATTHQRSIAETRLDESAKQFASATDRRDAVRALGAVGITAHAAFGLGEDAEAKKHPGNGNSKNRNQSKTKRRTSTRTVSSKMSLPAPRVRKVFKAFTESRGLKVQRGRPARPVPPDQPGSTEHPTPRARPESWIPLAHGVLVIFRVSPDRPAQRGRGVMRPSRANRST